MVTLFARSKPLTTSSRWSEAHTAVAVELFVEEQQVTPVGISLKKGDGGGKRPLPRNDSVKRLASVNSR